MQQQQFDVIVITLPAKGMSRALFANDQGPSPLRSKLYPYGFPWLSQHTKRVNDAVTIEASFLMVLAFAAILQDNTGMVLFAAEERGKAHFGEPCSWWQSKEVRHLSDLGAIRGAYYTCELVQKWTGKSIARPGSMGVMTNFSAKSAELKEGWPQVNGPGQNYSGPLSNRCDCGFSHTPLEQTRVQTNAVEPSVCAHLLQALPRLPEGKGVLKGVRLRGNEDGLFSPLTDPDSPGNFLFRQQPWLQARWKAWQ